MPDDNPSESEACHVVGHGIGMVESGTEDCVCVHIVTCSGYAGSGFISASLQ
jgi:hypothetical protein